MTLGGHEDRYHSSLTATIHVCTSTHVRRSVRTMWTRTAQTEHTRPRESKKTMHRHGFLNRSLDLLLFSDTRKFIYVENSILTISANVASTIVR